MSRALFLSPQNPQIQCPESDPTTTGQNTMMDFFNQHWALAIDWVAAHAVTPVVTTLNIAEAAGDPREIAAGILIALLQLLLIGGVMRPLAATISSIWARVSLQDRTRSQPAAMIAPARWVIVPLSACMPISSDISRP